MEKDPRLGRYATDQITDYQGTVVGVASYLTGCTQIGLAVKVGADGKIPPTEWFDEGRLTFRDEIAIKAEDVTGAENGGPNRDCPR
ncbi:hypothetical protein HDC90_001121 [Pedobacter sp. AK013]|uniref:hypothetical protein n=1 Tax=Pedobacter sp. AK013 TaxID=2723071 RepID=UPI00160E7822|nr:hypothetical protein [Pedobacter sp. AK013]MBB6236509.1 hypothetical protein [Pedobacter sp. AK013]